MSTSATKPLDVVTLRLKALTSLGTKTVPEAAHSNTSEALRILYELASAPDTASDALALLHELQVHQVELELQDEELRRTREELEAALLRQSRLYNYAPVACFAVERSTLVTELNLAGARLLGSDLDALVGCGLDTFLTPQSAREFHRLLEHTIEGQRGLPSRLELAAGSEHPIAPLRVVQAFASADPDGPRFFVSFIEATE